MRRFTIVELMIVVAIIGILAAVAIPAYQEYQVRARFAEAPINYDGLVQLVERYTAECSRDISAIGTLHPRDLGSLDKSATDFTTNASFEAIGYSPDGRVRCGYGFDSSIAAGWQVSVACDVDGDTDAFLARSQLWVDGVRESGGYCLGQDSSPLTSTSSTSFPPHPGCY